MLGKKGFFGFFKGADKPAIVAENEQPQKEYASRMAVATVDTVSDEVRDFCVERLREILRLMGFENAAVSVTHIEGDQLYLEIKDEAEAGRIIGREGSTLDAFQILIRAIVFRKYDVGAKVFVDAGNYRGKRNDSVKEMALKAYESGRRRVVLRSMNASERRVVHSLFQDNTTIKTYSIGRGEERHVVLERLKTVEA